LLESVWHHIRCGQLPEAQKCADAANAHWLAAMLLGVSYVYIDQESYNDISIRRGNSKRSNWSQLCYNYSLRLSKALMLRSSRYMDESIFHKRLLQLETAIFAALSNNIDVFLSNMSLLSLVSASQSPSQPVSSWSDRLWVIVKASHERDISELLLNYRMKRQDVSNFFLDSQNGTIAIENEQVPFHSTSNIIIFDYLFLIIIFGFLAVDQAT
jgi:hypothetical protein